MSQILNFFMFSKMKSISFKLLIFFFLSFFSVQNVLAIGVSPSIVELDGLANNIVLDKTLYMSRANPSKEEYYKITIEGDGAPYVSVDKTTIALPKGEKQVPFTVHIKPVAAPNGTYRAFLVITGTVPDHKIESGQNNVAFLTGVTAQIQFVITDKQIKKFDIVEVYDEETEVDQPFVFYFLLKNSGNVSARPDKIDLVFTDVSDPTHFILDSIDGPTLNMVAPLATEKVVAKSSAKVPEGKYNLEIKFISDQSVIFTKNFMVKILPKGSLAQKLEFISLQLNKQKYAVSEPVRFTGNVKNTGEVAIEPVFVVEISKDEQVLDLKRGDKSLVLKGEGQAFPLTYTPEEKGDYVAKAYFEYGARKSDVLEQSFTVGSDFTWKYIIMISILLILLIIFIILMSRRKKKDDQPPVVPPAPPVAPTQPIISTQNTQTVSGQPTPTPAVTPAVPVTPVVTSPNTQNTVQK